MGLRKKEGRNYRLISCYFVREAHVLENEHENDRRTPITPLGRDTMANKAAAQAKKK
jgi:hypothetical protein